MNEKQYINSSEKHFQTDIRILMGGKGVFETELLPKEAIPPPQSHDLNRVATLLHLSAPFYASIKSQLLVFSEPH